MALSGNWVWHCHVTGCGIVVELGVALSGNWVWHCQVTGCGIVR